MDLVLQCPKATDTQGQPAFVQANIDLTLDANITNNRNFDAPLGNGGPLVVIGRSNIADAVLIVNGNTEGGAFATPNYLTGSSGVGQSPQYGLLVGSKTLTWNGVIIPVPGVAGNPDVTTIRITNIQANLGRPGIPVGAKLAMRSPGYRLTESGLEWDASSLAAVPMNPPSGVGFLSAPASTALKIYPVVSPSTSGLGSGAVRLNLAYTNVPQGKEWIPSITYVFKERSPYAYNIQGFDIATTGLPNVSPDPGQQPRYQIPYGQTQAPYGAPIYPNPYDYGERRERQYDPWAAGVPLDPPGGPWNNPPVTPWEVPPWQIPGTIPWQYRR
ncbi:MAG TPA: hypothetical protein VGL11_04715 [Candidatus Binatia bacterium]|jgi:hypothetical protein